MNSLAQRFRVEVCGEVIELQLADNQLTVADQTVSWSCERLSEGNFSLIVNGKSHFVHVDAGEGCRARVSFGGQTLETHVQDERTRLLEQFGFESAASTVEQQLLAPMPGLVLAVLVQPGDEVGAGQGLLVLEAMKMENELRAKTDARIKAVHVRKGDAVKRQALLIEFE